MIVNDSGKEVGEEEFQTCNIVSWRAWPTRKSVEAITVFYTADQRRKLVKMKKPDFRKKLIEAKDE